MNVSIGSRLPAWAWSMCRVLVSELPESEREGFLSKTTLQPYTARTVSGINELRLELETVRAQGWSLVDQELNEGLRGLAVPVYRGAQLLGALNVSVQPGRIGSGSISDEMIPLVRKIASDIADDCGGRVPERNQPHIP